MSIFLVNDLHGHPALIEKAISAISSMQKGDKLIINGDGAGARGPKMNEIVRVFYKVKRGEVDFEELVATINAAIDDDVKFPKDWAFDALHAGLFRKVLADHSPKFRRLMEDEILGVIKDTLQPLSQAAQDKVKIIYLPGNGELVPDDFCSGNIDVEELVQPERRFYQRLANQGYFDQYRIAYVPYFTFGQLNRIALFSINLLDMSAGEAVAKLWKSENFRAEKPSAIVVHYPPSVSPVGAAFPFWTPNRMDRKRAETLSRILDAFSISGIPIYFGHIHLGPNDPAMVPYPQTMSFDICGNSCVWVKPGEVIKIG